MSLQVNILVIAKSARMLVQALAAAGHRTVAIDCYADSDLQQLAVDFIQVSDLNLANIRAPVLRVRKRHGLSYAVYGSGFERHLDSLIFLHTCFQVLGNSVASFSAVQDKKYFFRQLDRLGIRRPVSSFMVPRSQGMWLQKPHRGEGGLGICRYEDGMSASVEPVYWQKFCPGTPMSVLFVAGRHQVGIIGFQRQLRQEHEAAREFLFTGVMTESSIPQALHLRIQEWLLSIVRCFGLRGLNSLDFILQGQDCYVLEVNARPPASLQLFDACSLKVHIQACLSGSCAIPVHEDSLGAFLIIYASVDTYIGNSDQWPEWVMDRPVSGQIIGQGQPVCSIIARAKHQQQLMNCLDQRQQAVNQILATGTKSHA